MNIQNITPYKTLSALLPLCMSLLLSGNSTAGPAFATTTDLNAEAVLRAAAD
jgi:hypothetical protein